MKKKIGISFTSTHFQNYWDWFIPKDHSEAWELVELSFQKNNVKDLVSCDAFVLTGGVDIHPSYYNGSDQYPHQPDEYQEQRDQFESFIFKYAIDHDRPLLGICRGLQLVNVLMGGTLVQDLGDQNDLHKKVDQQDRMHPVTTVPGSLLYQVTQSLSGTVNSAHHQSIDQLGKNLMVNARSLIDGSVEGIEYENKTGKPFFLCVQWHPERMMDADGNPFSINIKQRFLEASGIHY